MGLQNEPSSVGLAVADCKKVEAVALSNVIDIELLFDEVLKVEVEVVKVEVVEMEVVEVEIVEVEDEEVVLLLCPQINSLKWGNRGLASYTKYL
jgi:hypothetical protein